MFLRLVVVVERASCSSLSFVASEVIPTKTTHLWPKNDKLALKLEWFVWLKWADWSMGTISTSTVQGAQNQVLCQAWMWTLQPIFTTDLPVQHECKFNVDLLHYIAIGLASRLSLPMPLLGSSFMLVAKLCHQMGKSPLSLLSWIFCCCVPFVSL